MASAGTIVITGSNISVTATSQGRGAGIGGGGMGGTVSGAEALTVTANPASALKVGATVTLTPIQNSFFERTDAASTGWSTSWLYKNSSNNWLTLPATESSGTWTASMPSDYNGEIQCVLNKADPFGIKSVIAQAPLAAKAAKPNAGIDYPNAQLTNLTANTIYIIGGMEYTTATTGTTLPILPVWCGTTVSIVRKGDATTNDSDAQTLSIPRCPP